MESVDRTLRAREQAIQLLKFHLQRAQDMMVHFANRHRTDRQFDVGNWVYLKLQPYRQLTLRKRVQNKLSSKFCGPFQVIQHIGIVAYKLHLHVTGQIRPIFHVSQLKLCKGTPTVTGSLPQ